jgi:hypothetical protein
MPALGRLRQEAHKFEARLGFIVRPPSQNETNQQKKLNGNLKY